MPALVSIVLLLALCMCAVWAVCMSVVWAACEEVSREEKKMAEEEKKWAEEEIRRPDEEKGGWEVRNGHRGHGQGASLVVNLPPGGLDRMR